jgi:(R,R)-butanediol dehydrogenase/meso-butanediol dehydrogenase/diacetyl reductase
LIVGAGPVGLTIAMWCRFFGAQHIVVSDLVQARAEMSRALGATAIVDASQGNVAEQAADAAGGPPGVVFDCVGVPGSLQLAINYSAPDGRIVVVGLCMAGDHLFPTKALVKELDISFAFVYRQEDFTTVVHLLGKSRIDAAPMISDFIEMADLPMEFEALKQPNRQIKVMLELP